MLKSRSVIITHGDIDGMVCAAQLLRREKSNCDISFSNAGYIKSAFNRIVRSKESPYRIYISDIPANDGVIEILSALSENGSEIYWIDHHPWQENVRAGIEKYCIEIIYNESLQTPAGILLGQWLKDEDPYFDQIGKICYAYERGTEWERGWFLLLSSYIGHSERDVLERLAYNQDFTEGDLERIEQKKLNEQKAREILKQNPQTVKTKSNKMISIYDTSMNTSIYLGHRVFEYHDVDYCLIRISQRKWQLASNPSRKHSMELLMGKHCIDGAVFSVAGRKNELLAIVLERNDKNLNFHHRLTNWLCDRM